MVARAFLSNIITRHGIPLEVSSDRGAQFTSAIFTELAKLMGMKQILSTAYRPQTQGLVERYNRTLTEMLRQFVAADQKDWCTYLELVVFAYRTSIHSSTGHTPFELMYGRQARLPSHLLLPDVTIIPESQNDYVDTLHERLKTAFTHAAAANTKASHTQKEHYDKAASSTMHLQAGDSVYLQRPSPQAGLTPKLQPKYKGPYNLLVILGKDGLIRLPPPSKAQAVWVHLDHLKKAETRGREEFNYDEALAEGSTSGEPEELLPAEKEAEEEILDEDIVWDDEVEEGPEPRYNFRPRK
jgi:hypothetical protein